MLFDSLEDQRVLIVGGSSGMGFGTAQLIDKLKGRVIIASHDHQKLNKALEQLSDRAQAITVDMTQPDSIDELFAQITGLDHLFITAGPGSRSGFLDDSGEQARAYMEGKFWSTYRLTQLAVPKLRRDGSVTYISGGLSQRPEAGSVMVTVAQRALEGLAKALAVELAPLRFNVVRPGAIDTSLWDFMDDSDRRHLMEEAAAKTPAGRVGTVEDIALAVAHSMSNSFINGAVIDVDGGALLR
ncbi:SDR family oxidoreductase [Fibrisoma montanum]|uniref:SDR family oxidoreductase n=1 Tax=Fibrisoma montanum TaxID=2305895 RepID=A0A418MI14_9BACT|nr:SDR family oxidoreductase [Fibrisoma montanum]RIV27064.1 SDR family oxidoreductase [Fibrisoma montanum]